MQSDVPPLPIACLIDSIRLRRNNSFKARPNTQDCKSHSLCKSSKVIAQNSLSSKRKLQTLVVKPSPYKNSARPNPPDTAKSSDRSVINQRVSSAKMLRIKQLQNQLADAHFHLNELSNENKLLKAIQKRQDTALKRYEGTSAELPRIINTHHEDLRVLQTKHKKLRVDYNKLSEAMKEKDNDLRSLQAQNKKLLQLSKDRHLGEREKLQAQVFDLNHRISQQDEIIQNLKRKLALESKYLKHQLHAEITKHKETQKQLQDAQIKLKSLEELMEQREKRSYQASRMAVFTNKSSKPRITSQSLTNLHENRIEHLVKGHGFRRQLSSKAVDHLLPTLNGLPKSQSVDENSQKSVQDRSLTMTETIQNFEQSKHVRLQNSPALLKPGGSYSTSISSISRDSPVKELLLEESDADLKKFKESSASMGNNRQKPYALPANLKKEFNYSSDDEKNEDEQLNNVDSVPDSAELIARSRLLHARLVNSAAESLRTKSNTEDKSRSQSLTRENLENIVESDREIKYDRDSAVTVISKDMLKDYTDVDRSNDNDSIGHSNNDDVESEIELPVDFNIEEEDEDVARKTDIDIDKSEFEKQPNISSYLSNIHSQPKKSSNFLFNSQEDDDFDFKLSNSKDVVSLKSELVQDLSKSIEVISEDIDKVDDLLTQKKSVLKGNHIETSWDSDLSQDSFYFDRISIGSEKSSVKHKFEKVLEEPSREETTSSKTKRNASDPNVNSSLNRDSKSSEDKRPINAATKAALFAAFKAIDDNENVEFVEQKVRKNSATRLQITENLYRGIPAHSKKQDFIKDLFSENTTDNNKISKKS